MTSQTFPDELNVIVSALLRDLSTPMALKVAIQLREGDWDGIATNKVDPRAYLDAPSYFADAAAVNILRKLKQLPTGIDKHRNAMETWWDGERACYKTNERLCRYLPEHANAADRDGRVDSFLDETRKLILSWLGHAPPELLEGRFGPGATFADRGRKTTVPDKMSNTPVLTRDAIWYLPQWLGTQWGSHSARRHGEFTFVRGNRLAVAEKDATKGRVIGTEPPINVFYQLAVGRAMRRRLKWNSGWDLDCAQEIHRQIACESSVTGEFCTLDLTNASGTVARNFVKLQLPQEWYQVCEDLRSPMTLVNGKWVMLEQFSSMGNGYTFELETILFAALACIASRRCGYAGVLGKDVFVFGDDIIVKNDVARPLYSCLRFFGFELSEGKSFYGDVPFRESCGGDFFNGKSVRPYFLKEIPETPVDYVAFANGVHALINRLRLSGVRMKMTAWTKILDCVPFWVRNCRGPQGLGDVVIHDDNVQNHRPFWQHGIRYYRAILPDRLRRVSFDRFDPEVVLACATYGTGGGIENGVVPRDGVLSYKVGRVAYS